MDFIIHRLLFIFHPRLQTTSKYTEDTLDPYRIQRDNYPLPIRRSFFDSTGG